MVIVPSRTSEVALLACSDDITKISLISLSVSSKRTAAPEAHLEVLARQVARRKHDG
jgi:hypothetical protein